MKNREIRFRAWHDGRIWNVIHIFLIEKDPFAQLDYLPEHGDYVVKNVDLSDLHLMQYTNLKDKHGKEIYEGDIIRSSIDDSEEVWTVEIDPLAAIWSPQGKAFDNSWIEHEVIGNIWEHPHLLTTPDTAADVSS